MSLPVNVLSIILKKAEGKNIYLVCQYWRDIAYTYKADMKVSSDTIVMHCGLLKMCNLRKIHIVYIQSTDISTMMATLEMMRSIPLSSIVMQGFPFHGNFRYIVDVLRFFPVEQLVCQGCAKVSVHDVLHLLDVFPLIKFCIVDVQTNAESEKKVLARMVNSLAGQVNFSTSLLEMIPSKLFWFDLAVYRCVSPTGRIEESLE